MSSVCVVCVIIVDCIIVDNNIVIIIIIVVDILEWLVGISTHEIIHCV